MIIETNILVKIVYKDTSKKFKKYIIYHIVFRLNQRSLLEIPLSKHSITSTLLAIEKQWRLLYDIFKKM